MGMLVEEKGGEISGMGRGGKNFWEWEISFEVESVSVRLGRWDGCIVRVDGWASVLGVVLLRGGVGV